MDERTMRQLRSVPTQFAAKRADDSGDLYIEGYFAVFGGTYELWPGATESIAPGAFADSLGGDIRALVDHETRLVLGRCKAGTLELREDSHGLWGRVKINQADTDAMNLYSRVQRGDVDQCSFGFDILEEDIETMADGSTHWTICRVQLYEVSVVTFPAYEDTGVAARKRDFEEIEKRKLTAWRDSMRKRVKEE